MSDSINANGGFGPVETFRSYCKKYHFNHAGLFGVQDGYFLLTKAFGLDAETIVLSQSSTDFWEGTLPQMGKWFTFNEGEEGINQFYQFFSDATKGKIQQLNFVKFSTEDDEQYVFFAAQFKGEGKINTEMVELFRLSTEVLKVRPAIKFDPAKIQNGLNFQEAALFQIKLGKAINNYLNTKDFNSDIIQDDMYATIYNELFDSFHAAFSGRNIASSWMTENVNAVIFTAVDLQPELIYKQLTTITSGIIGSQYFTADAVSFEGKTKDTDKIMNFLCGEE